MREISVDVGKEVDGIDCMYVNKVADMSADSVSAFIANRWARTVRPHGIGDLRDRE